MNRGEGVPRVPAVERHPSTDKLQQALAARDEQVAALTRKVQLLTASHKAILLAVDEVGGTNAWARFFASYKDSIGALREPEALPVAPGKPALAPHPPRARGARPGPHASSSGRP